MEEQETEYGWLRFVAGLQVFLGILSLLAGAGGLAFAALAVFQVVQMTLDVWVWGVWSAVFLLTGVVMIGFGQGIRALTEIADNARLIPLILERMAESHRDIGYIEPPSIPEMGSPPSGERSCPNCGTPVSSSRSVCPACGTRIPLSRPD